ncbi:MAG: glycosyltransferase [Rhodospirillaceae bacterium]
MTRPGIFFEGVDIYGLPGTDSYWNATVRDISRAVTAAGTPCEPFSLQDSENTVVSFDTSDLPPFAITWNFNSGRWAHYQGRQVRMTSVLPIPNTVLLWDHPVHWAETIQELRDMDLEFGRTPGRIGVMDDGHMAFLRAMGIPESQVFRWRQAGPPPTDAPPADAREVGAVFHGTINDVEPFDDFCVRMNLRDGAVQRAVQEAIAAIIETPIDVHDAVQQFVIAPNRLDPAPLAVAPLCREIDLLTRTIRRVAFLSGLRELAVHFIGKVAPSFRAANPNGVYPGPLPFGEIEAYLRNAKVVLYDTINFRDAAVMRLFYSVQCGCVPAAETNRYLDGAFEDGADMVKLQLRDPAGNADKLRAIIADAGRAETIANAARRTCATSHTWANRIGPLVDAIRDA